MGELNAMLISEMRKAMSLASNQMLPDMYGETYKFYTKGKPKEYERTGALGDTPKVSPLTTMGNVVYFDAYLDILTAKIPNVLVMQPFEIVGYVYEEGEDGSGQSLVRFRINVISRPMPSDAIYPGTVDYVSYAEIMENCREFTVSESNRVIAEQNRATAESERVAAETERANAEQNRVAAWANALGIKEITIQDLDNNKQYIYQYVIQDGHLGIVLTEATATVEETS